MATKQFNRTVEAINVLLDKLDNLPIAPMAKKGTIMNPSYLPDNATEGDVYLVLYSDSENTETANSLYYRKANEWEIIATKSYTKAEIDDMLDSKQPALSSSQLAAVNSGITAEKVEQIEQNKEDILLVEQMNGKKNLLNFKLWANRTGVYNGTKSVNGDSISLTSTSAGCTTYAQPEYFPQEARIPVTADQKLVFTWDTTSTTAIGYAQICPEGIVVPNTEVGINKKRLEYTVPSNTSYVTFRLGIYSAVGVTITVSNMMIVDKSVDSAGFTDYQPYAMSNVELTAAIQALQAQLATQ